MTEPIHKGKDLPHVWVIHAASGGDSEAMEQVLSGLVGVRQDGTANYYYLTLRDSTRSLMELGYRLEEFM